MDAKDRIIELSKKYKRSHIGSSLTALPIIQKIFKVKQPNEKFVLSNGHAALALYVTLYPEDEEALPWKKCLHADSSWCDCSTGALGHGLGIAVGMALSDRSKNVYCLISDGECAEGSVWEALRIASEQKLDNLKVYVNANGYASYQSVDLDRLEARLLSFFPVNFVRTKQVSPFIGLNGHYGKAS